ncbi:hypothetical protein MAIT1_02124 [Magnetofaba australis IT-1]|uniref:PKD domain-containing protein n=2 Tax=Magnetofaba TaxID=1472292 RepID=A0A1Y2K213_9PROT|nr:hypothetical protein MAIT1_02124 [Magnetofaba australis IT-1]
MMAIVVMWLGVSIAHAKEASALRWVTPSDPQITVQQGQTVTFEVQGEGLTQASWKVLGHDKGPHALNSDGRFAHQFVRPGVRVVVVTDAHKRQIFRRILVDKALQPADELSIVSPQRGHRFAVGAPIPLHAKGAQPHVVWELGDGRVVRGAMGTAVFTKAGQHRIRVYDIEAGSGKRRDATVMIQVQ